MCVITNLNTKLWSSMVVLQMSLEQGLQMVVWWFFSHRFIFVEFSVPCWAVAFLMRASLHR